LRPETVVWPSFTEKWNAPTPSPAAPDTQTICLTVQDGGVYVSQPGQKWVNVEVGLRTLFGQRRLASHGYEFDGPLTLNQPWFGNDVEGPADRLLLGLQGPVNWQGLGQTFLLQRQTSQEAPIREALNLLADSAGTLDASERADKLARGQQALRAATLRFVLGDESRWLERVLEGLAHYERGRALLGLNDRVLARNAFVAAAVAFYEGLEGEDLRAASGTQGGLSAVPAPRLHPGLSFGQLSAKEQGLLLARFYYPWALLQARWLDDALPAEQAEDTLPKWMREQDLMGAFRLAESVLNPAVESLGAQYGLALAHARQATPESQHAATMLLEELQNASAAGVSEPARAVLEGYRQAAFVAHAELLWKQARGAPTHGLLHDLGYLQETFLAHYPLGQRSVAFTRMLQARFDFELAHAEQAFKAGRHEAARDLYMEVLAGPEAQEVLSTVVRVRALGNVLDGALQGADVAACQRLARQIQAEWPNLETGSLSDAEMIRLQQLIERAKKLPDTKAEQREAQPIPLTLE
jgi:hypothetical protein